MNKIPYKSLRTIKLKVLGKSRSGLVSTNKILASVRSVNGALSNIFKGRGSRTKGPVSLHELDDKRKLLVDGYHRFAKATSIGTKRIRAKVVSKGYTDSAATPRKIDEFKMSHNIPKLYLSHNTAPGVPVELNGICDGLTFRKELIPVGAYWKKTANHDQHFTIDSMKLAHWESTGNRMILNGVQIPLPLKHNDSPESNRGRAIRFERGLNEKGVEALFAVLKFRDAEAARMAKSTDVSIYVPEDPVTDGLGNEYVYPIRHIALTDYPVIPGLSGFTEIAASFDVFEMKPLELAAGIGSKKYAAVKQNAFMRALKKEPGYVPAAREAMKGAVTTRINRLAKQKTLRRAKKLASIVPKRALTKAISFKQHVKRGLYKAVNRATTEIPRIGKALSGVSTRGRLGIGAGILAAGAIGARRLTRRNKRQELSLGGPGSGPNKGTGIVKYNGLKERSVGDYVRMKLGKLAPHASKAAKAGGRIVKGIASNPLVHAIGGGEALNYAGKKIRGDNENKRVQSHVTSVFGVGAIKHARNAEKANRYLKTIKHPPTLRGLRVLRANSVLGAALTGGITALGVKGLLHKNKPKKVRIKKQKDKSLSLGGEGSGPNAGVKRGPYKIGRSLGSRHGAAIGEKVGEFAEKTVRRTTKNVARGIVTGELTNLAAKKLRGDDENRRVPAYLSRFLVQQSATGAHSAYKSGGAAKELWEAAEQIKNPRAKVFAKIAAAGAKASKIKSIAGSGLTGVASVFSIHALLKRNKNKSKSLSLGGEGSGPNAGEKRGEYKKEGSIRKWGRRYVKASIGVAALPYIDPKGAIGLKSVYHGTSADAKRKILKRGLKPSLGGLTSSGIPEVRGSSSNYNAGKVFVSSSPFISRMYSRGSKLGSIIRGTVSLKDWENKFHIDKATAINKNSAAYTENKIGPTALHGSAAPLKAKLARRIKDIRSGFGTKSASRARLGTVIGGGALALIIRDSIKRRQNQQKELSLGVVLHGLKKAGQFATSDAHTVGLAGHTVGDKAKKRRTHLLAGGVLAGSAVLGARELKHSSGAIRKIARVGTRQFKKRGFRGIGSTLLRSTAKFSGPKFGTVVPKATGILGKTGAAISRVAGTKGILHAGVLASRTALPVLGAALGAGALYSGVKGAIKHFGKARKIKPKRITLSLDKLVLGGPGSGPNEGQKRGDYKDRIKNTLKSHGAKSVAYGIGSSASLVGTRYIAGKTFKIKNPKRALATTAATLAIGGGAAAYSGIKSWQHFIKHVRERFAKKELSLALNEVDKHGNIHGKGGRFTVKPDRERSKGQLHRKVHSKYASKLFEDKSPEDTGTSKISSGFQVAKHAATAAVLAPASYLTGRNAIRSYKDVARKTGASLKTGGYKTKIDTSKAAQVKAKTSVQRNVASGYEGAKGHIVAKSKSTARRYGTKAAEAVKGATKLRAKRLAKLPVFRKTVRALVKNKGNFVKAAAAASAAALAAYQTNLAVDAARSHAGNVLGVRAKNPLLQKDTDTVAAKKKRRRLIEAYEDDAN